MINNWLSSFKKHFNFILLSFVAIDVELPFKIKYLLIPFQCVFLIYSFSHYDYLKEKIYYLPYAILPIYFIFLFTCFSKNGFRKYFIQKFGEETGYEISRTILNIIFFWYGCALTSVSYFNQGTFVNYQAHIYFKIIGSLFFIIGVLLRHSAVYHAGYYAYYAKDLFLQRKISDFTKKGVYKYFNNPMYGIGYLHAYGIAVFYESIQGVIATAACQIILFTFFYKVEWPHIKENIIDKSINT